MKQKRTIHNIKKDYQAIKRTANYYHELLENEMKYCSNFLSSAINFTREDNENNIKKAKMHFQEAKYCMHKIIASIKKMQNKDIEYELNYQDDEEDN